MFKKLYVSAEQDVAGPNSRTNDKEDLSKRSQRLQQLKPGYKQPHHSPSAVLWISKVHMIRHKFIPDFPLEEILAEHVVNGEIKYLVRWLGRGDEDNS
uniref:Chromo domain-containing protein n=1 Tax=Ditylenchus dipsaci TaxID=166011 RepID=A0A915CUJ9_9BILA